ncbi:MAG: protoglobin domain-containing protein [Burkholderiaceae bacterium]|nr:protoglobin domain-containing protein [Burkholderiaceae bacterium]
MNLYELTRSIIDSIPEQQRFSTHDEALLQRFKAPLLALEDDLVRGFYDEIEANPKINALLGDGARAQRELTLRRWWQRSLAGPIDEQYWAWQALVGVVHIKVGVKNSMMMGMWQWILARLRERITAEITGDEATREALLAAMGRLALTTQAITAESFLMNYLETVIRLTGFKPALLERMFKTEIDLVLAEARQQLGQVG